MVKFISFFIFLLVPIIFLLFVKRRNKKHVIFPHYLFRQNQKKIINAVLLKILHLFNDILFDVIIALLLAIILAQLSLPIIFPTNAVCIDGSYSMIMGDYENRIINKIIEYYISNKENFGKHDLFILTFDPQKGKSYIKKINEFKKISKHDVFLSQLLATFVFHNISYEHLAQLYTFRYKKTYFLTDDFPYQDTNIEIKNFGRVSKDFIYPIGIDDSILFGMKKLILYSSDELDNLRILVYKDTQFLVLEEDKYKVSYLADRYYQIEFLDYGMYAIDTQDLSFVIPCFKPNIDLEASGSYSELFIAVWKDYMNTGSSIIKREKIKFIDKTETEIIESSKRSFKDKNGSQKSRFSMIYTIPLKNNGELYSYLHSFFYTLNNPLLANIDNAVLQSFILSELNNTGYPVFLVQENLLNKYLPLFYYSISIVQHFAYYNEYISFENLVSLNYFKKFGTSYLYGSYPENYRIININPEELFPRRKQKLIFTKIRSYIGLIYIIMSLYIIKAIVLLYIKPIKSKKQQ